jgi:hypothetical protein
MINARKRQKLTSLLFFIVAAVALIFMLNPGVDKEIPLSELAKEINQGTVKRIGVSGKNISIDYNDGGKLKSSKEENVGLVRSLSNWAPIPKK